jgi:hypothetical protein
MIDVSQIDHHKLDELDVEQLRALALALLDSKDHEIAWRDAKIDKLNYSPWSMR